jgi:hypothetical protein
VTSERDPFGTLGEKFMFLLQLPPGTPVGIQRGYWESLLPDFETAGLRPMALQNLTPGTRLGAAFLEMKGLGALGQHLEKLTGDGKAIVLSRQHLIPASWRRGQLRRIVRHNGFTVHAEFRPYPTMELVEAYLLPAADAASWDLRKRSIPSRISRLFKPHGKQRIWFVTRPNHPLSGFDRAALLAVEATGEQLAVERFHLRRRGALVFVMTGEAVRRVLRVATNRSVAALTRRNHEVLRWLRAQDLPDSVKSLLPAPLGVARSHDVEAFAEEFKPGRMAWTLYRDADCRGRIDAALFRFSHQLQHSTRRDITLSPAQREAFIGRHLGDIRLRLGTVGRIAQQLDLIGHRLRRLLEGRKLPVSVGHGDYGIGNALAMADGVVTAVIDWDQFEEMDLPGVDWCDYVLKANHYRQSVPEAFRRLLEESSRTGWLAPAHRGFGAEDFGLTAADLRLIPGLAVVREINRAARFPAELQGAAAYYAEQLELVGGCLPGVGE